MSTAFIPTAAKGYNRALRYSRKRRLLPQSPIPQPTAVWPRQNVALLEQYWSWLVSSGYSQDVADRIYIPMAGHVLGLTLKPHDQLDLNVDLECALDYIRAKRLSAEWTDICRVALEKFRYFLRQQRGEWPIEFRQSDYERYTAGLPDWLLAPLTCYFHLMRSHWRPARAEQQGMRFWYSHVRLWRWLLERFPITGIMALKRQHLLDYVDHCLTEGYAVSTINNALRNLHAFLLYLQDQDYRIPQALLRMPKLKQPERLPRFLTDEQVGRLRDDLEQHVAQALSSAQRRDACLDRAAFYLLWQSGLRLGEVEELRLEDLDLAGRKLTVRQGKGQKDRTAYLTDLAVGALQGYLVMRGPGRTEHVFLYRNRPICKDLIRERIQSAGKRAGIAVTPHRLRHTCATQLVNAGCGITSIQKLLGHRDLSSTMIYARVHDHTLSADYYTAMRRIEKALALPSGTETAGEAGDQRRLLELADRLADPQLGLDQRLELAAQLRQRLSCKGAAPTVTE